ncbi:hypothetical protein EDB81DRAFT_327031 [Dactylonectria macrodidyma]|uniref:Uncharacterized protein n=1 Tax=Dactylonectria macrodidyma TaxID=307937 RepID=A0A9P9FFN1_9HYPO|nr:hypothetical protein EDB81DRAFT_327031 [Dactylonectria macrodidyma]
MHSCPKISRLSRLVLLYSRLFCLLYYVLRSRILHQGLCYPSEPDRWSRVSALSTSPHLRVSTPKIVFLQCPGLHGFRLPPPAKLFIDCECTVLVCLIVCKEFRMSIGCQLGRFPFTSCSPLQYLYQAFTAPVSVPRGSQTPSYPDRSSTSSLFLFLFFFVINQKEKEKEEQSKNPWAGSRHTFHNDLLLLSLAHCSTATGRVMPKHGACLQDCIPSWKFQLSHGHPLNSFVAKPCRG